MPGSGGGDVLPHGRHRAEVRADQDRGPALHRGLKVLAQDCEEHCPEYFVLSQIERGQGGAHLLAL